MSWGLDNVFIQVGLVAIIVFFALEWLKPAAMYDEKTGLPKYELITPCSVAVVAGLLVLAFNYKKLGAAPSPEMAKRAAAVVGAPPSVEAPVPETFSAETVDATNVANLEGWADATNATGPSSFPLDTFLS